MRSFFVVGLRVLLVDAVLSSWRSALPGVAGRLLTFFASPKKVSKERRPRRRCPFGVPVCAKQKMGSGRNSLRYAAFRQQPLLFPFSVPHKRHRHSGIQKREMGLRYVALSCGIVDPLVNKPETVSPHPH